jgi:uncharacterized protein (DUF302 family)
MAKKGVEFSKECLTYEVCNPFQAKKVLEANPSISTALPCRIAVFEEGDHLSRLVRSAFSHDLVKHRFLLLWIL